VNNELEITQMEAGVEKLLLKIQPLTTQRGGKGQKYI